MIDSFRQIPIDGETKSLSGLMFREYAANRISLEEWILSGMKEIADDADKYQPTPYPPMPIHIRIYAENRITGRSQYSDQSSGELAVWAREASRRLDRNTIDLETLTHARTRSEASEMLKTGIPKLDRAITRFMNRTPPISDLKNAHTVLELDSQARTSKIKNGNRDN